MKAAVIRKVIGLGGTLAICLPTAWYREHGIKAGDRVAAVWGESVLTIVPDQKIGGLDEKPDSSNPGGIRSQ